MTVKHLINLLSRCDQNAEVEITFCYNRSRAPGDCVSLIGRHGGPLILQNPDEGTVELFASNEPGVRRNIETLH